MPCTTILVGSKASYDGSTMIARNDDGHFDVKRLTVTPPDKLPRNYKSVISHLKMELPEAPLRFTSCPNVDPSEGIWAASGINAANVSMSASETITTNAVVMGADPYVRYQPANGRKKEIPGGIGEEDLVMLVLPYIRSAKEGVLRLGSLLEKYGTYEPNGIAFNDEKDIWWMETIGGHHWIARRVRDEEVVIMPNQFGLDRFDFSDAFGEQKENLCSADLREFIERNHLDCNVGEEFDPRKVFGSHTDADHYYNTPRAWFMGRFLAPRSYFWDGEDADFTPMSDDIPWALEPERKLTVEDIKYILGSHYQGTPYDPYRKGNYPEKGVYRPIGKNNTGVMTVGQIRPYMPEAIKAVEWVCFGSTTFDALTPVYPNTDKIPDYLSKVGMEVSTDNFYWNSRLISALADLSFAANVVQVERYHWHMGAESHRILNEYDAKMSETGDFSLIDEANRALCDSAKRVTADALKNILAEASNVMKNGYSRGDN